MGKTEGVAYDFFDRHSTMHIFIIGISFFFTIGGAKSGGNKHRRVLNRYVIMMIHRRIFYVF